MAGSAEPEESEFYQDTHDGSQDDEDFDRAAVTERESDGYYQDEYAEDDYRDEYQRDEYRDADYRLDYAEYEEGEYQEYDGEYDTAEYEEYEDDEQLTDELPIPEEEQPYQRQGGPRSRPYRPGRGGFNPEAAEIAKQAKYAFRRRVVLAMVIGAVATLVGAAIAFSMLWWAHAVIDLSLIGYLVYLRRQVRIEEEVRQRRLARIRGAREAERAHQYHQRNAEQEQRPTPAPRNLHTPPPVLPGTAVVDVDDDDPAFDELDEPDVLPYRRAVGE